jgi:iron complex transport system ATP-binding protein
MTISVQNLDFFYGKRQVLHQIAFQGKEGQLISLLGPNGAGKSTLFRCMLGLLKPTQGRILIEGVDISRLQPGKLATKIAYIPQSHEPVFRYTAFDMVLMGTTAGTGRFSPPGREQKERVEQVMEALGLTDLCYRSYGTLSGGERQLILIARAMAQEGKILLMDEPSASLDFGNRFRVMDTVRELCNRGYCVIQSTHDPEQAYYYSDSLLALREGRILAQGKPGEIFREELISDLYGVEVELCSIKNDTYRICIQKENKK